MNFGICNLSNIPIRLEAKDSAEMVSELLFGDHFKVLSTSKQWLQIEIAFDGYQGWIDKKQCTEITKDLFDSLSDSPLVLSNNLVDFVEDTDKNLTAILLGTRLPFIKKNKFKLNGTSFTFDGNIKSGKADKNAITKTAFMYLNTPYLWGGKTPFGIDCSGFTQMVYKINGYQLLRDASLQATQGEVLSFIEESEPGDLAFFDNEEGHITHVGIILANNHIIHASGKVRIDRLDQSGIYNAELKKHTHKLRVIKKIF